MLRKLILTTTAVAALSGTAAAADLASKHMEVTVPPLPFSWTGFFGGVTLGTAAIQSRETGVGPVFMYPGDSLNSDGAGVIGGIEGGYNYQIGSLVLGAEADYSASSARAAFQYYYAPSIGNYRLQEIGSLRARIGYASDRALVYMTGGLAVGNIDNSFTDNSFKDGIYKQKSTRVGSIVGAGIEYAISSNWTIKAEGLYYNLASKTYGDELGGNDSYSYSDKSSGLIGRVGVNYLLSANPAVPSAPSVNWTGIYVGGIIGATQHRSDVVNPGGDNSGIYLVLPGDKLPSTGAGVAGGLEFGYDYQIGSLVLGAEGDYSLSSAKASATTYQADITSESRLNGLGTVRARVGYALDKALVYATGGAAIGSVRSRLHDDDWGYAPITKTRVGSVVGGGIEYALTEHVSLKGEGLYYHFADKTFTDTLENTSALYTEKTSGLVTRVGLNYKF